MFQSHIVSVKTIYKTAFILMALTVLAGISRAEGPAAHPDFGDSPTPVNILIVILDLDEVKTADQSFVANVFLEYRWQDSRLIH